MMEDWTDIIGEELESFEEPLPADDWSVLQQKYEASRKKKRAAFFAWTGGLTGIAAAVALVLLLIRPDSPAVIPGPADDLVADEIPPVEVVTPADTVTADPAPEAVPEAPEVHESQRVLIADSATGETSAETDGTETVSEETETEDVKADGAEDKVAEKEEVEVFDVIRDTTSMNDRLIADASDPSDTSDPKQEDDETYSPTGTFGFEDFPEEPETVRRRKVIMGMSGTVSGTPIIKIMKSDPSLDLDPPCLDPPIDSVVVETPEPEPEPTPAMMKRKSAYDDSYSHEMPVSLGLSVRYPLTDRISVNTGLNYTRYASTRERYYYGQLRTESERQYVHYLGIPVRLDWLAVKRKHFEFYLGAGAQMDKCVYAVVGNERLHEKEFLFSVNGTMGMQVNIVPRVGLYFEPEISYALNEGSLKTFRTKEPLMISARAGLRFSF